MKSITPYGVIRIKCVPYSDYVAFPFQRHAASIPYAKDTQCRQSSVPFCFSHNLSNACNTQRYSLHIMAYFFSINSTQQDFNSMYLAWGRDKYSPENDFEQIRRVFVRRIRDLTHKLYNSKSNTIRHLRSATTVWMIFNPTYNCNNK